MDCHAVRLSIKKSQDQNRYSVSFIKTLMFSFLVYNETIGVGPVNHPSIT